MNDLSTPAQPFRVAALYRFVRLEHHESLRAPLAAFCCGRGIKGTLLLAREGINGTVAGSAGGDRRADAPISRPCRNSPASSVKYSAAT